MHFFNPVRYMKLLELVAGPDTSPETLEAVRRFGEDVLGKGIVVGKDTPNFVGNRIGAHAMMATIHLMLERGPRARGRRRDHRRGDGAPEERELPHGRPRRRRHLRARGRQLLRVAHGRRGPQGLRGARPTSARWSRRSSSATRPRAASTARARTARSRRSTRRRSSTARAGGDKEIRNATKELAQDRGPARARAQARRRAGQDGRLRVEGALAVARVLGAAHRRDRRRRCVGAIDDAMKWGYNWELGPFETWDALGFEAVVDRMKKDGVALPASIDKMRASRREELLHGRRARLRPAQGRVRQARGRPAHRDAHRAAQGRRAGAQERRRRGVGPGRRRARAHLQDEGEQHRPGRHQDDPRLGRDGRDATSARWSSPTRASTSASGANLFLVVMAAGQKQWDQIRDLVRRLPGRVPAHEVRERAGRRRAVRHDARRRSRGVPRRRQRAGGGRDVRGPRRGRRRPRAGRRRAR